jgi:hypothetical protein
MNTNTWVHQAQRKRKEAPEFTNLLPVRLTLEFIDAYGNSRNNSIYFYANEGISDRVFEQLINKVNKNQALPLLGTDDLNL